MKREHKILFGYCLIMVSAMTIAKVSAGLILKALGTDDERDMLKDLVEKAVEVASNTIDEEENRS